MDRISGVLPQIGWSPAMAPVSAERAPATTVEAISQSSTAGGGMGANIDTQTGSERAADISAMMRRSGLRAETTILANSEKIDPRMTAGPKPTFEVSPLEAKVAELSDPGQITAKTDDEASKTLATAGNDDPPEQNAPAKQAGSDPVVGSSQTEWQTLDSTAQGQSLDLLR